MLPHTILSSTTGETELDRARRDNELLQKKLSKAISKKDYYAKLYYSCMLERDKATAEREGAIRELQRVLIQLHQHGHDLSPTSDSLSDASGSNLTATPLTLSRSVSLASLLSYFQSHPSTNLPSPVEDSGLCTGGSTSSLATNKESLNSSPNDMDARTHLSPTYEGTLVVPLPSITAGAVQPTKQRPDVNNLLTECAEALEGIADLGVQSDGNKSENIRYKQATEQEGPRKAPRVSPLLSNTTRKVLGKPLIRDQNKFVDTFDSVSVSWPDRGDAAYTRPNTLDTIPTSLLEEYVQDSSSPYLDVRHSFDKNSVRNQTSTLDRIEEMSCESSVSDHSTDIKAMESHVLLQRPDCVTDSKLIGERTESTLTSKRALSYGNLTTYELRQILFELSTSPDPGNYLEFYRCCFEDEWVLLLLCDEIKRNTTLASLYLVECNLHMAPDGLVQLFTAVTHSRLTTLSLARNGLTDRVIDSFRMTEFFHSRISLKILDLSENFLSPEAVESLHLLRGSLKCELILHKQFLLRSRPSLQFQLV